MSCSSESSRVLLQSGDEEGASRILEVIEEWPGAVQAGCELLWRFYNERGDDFQRNVRELDRETPDA